MPRLRRDWSAAMTELVAQIILVGILLLACLAILVALTGAPRSKPPKGGDRP